MWTLPRHRFDSGYVLDCEDFNANMTQFANELNGSLNEHNWSNGVLQAVGDALQLDDDIGLSVYTSRLEVDPHAAYNTMLEIPHTTTWIPLDGISVDFVSRGGTAMVLISIQQTNSIAIVQEQTGLNYALGLDGSVQLNAMLGTGDMSNDFKSAGDGITLGVGTVTFDYGTSPSFRAQQVKLLLTGMVRLTPGPHTIQLYARNLATLNASTTPPQYISLAEVIVIEGWQ